MRETPRLQPIPAAHHALMGSPDVSGGSISSTVLSAFSPIRFSDENSGVRIRGHGDAVETLLATSCRRRPEVATLLRLFSPLLLIRRLRVLRDFLAFVQILAVGAETACNLRSSRFHLP